MAEIEELRAENERLRNSFGLQYKTHPEYGQPQELLAGKFPHFVKLDEYSTVQDSNAAEDSQNSAQGVSPALTGLFDMPDQESIKNASQDDTATRHLDHVLIESDNLVALTALQASHKNAIDVIYIDPPYNTGKDFVYNDSFVSNDDGFKHGKWLGFMRARLELARNLMTEDGLIFVSIDDYEQAYLKVLMDNIFGEKNFILTFSWISSVKPMTEFSDNEKIVTLGSNLGKHKRSHEYVLAYRKSSKGKFALTASAQKTLQTRITKRGNARQQVIIPAGTRATIENAVFTGTIGGKSEPLELLDDMVIENGKLLSDVRMLGDMANPGIVKAFYTGDTEKLVDSKGQRYLEIFINNTGIPQLVKEKGGEIISSVLSGFGDTSASTKQLLDIIGGGFEHPKPVALVQTLIGLHHNKDATVLDFFAGSGTTGEAVARLNVQDGGNRQAMLITNNFEQSGAENGIARDVTAVRMRRVLTGQEWASGKLQTKIPGNLHYYKVELAEIDEKDHEALGTSLHNDNLNVSGNIAVAEHTHHSVKSIITHPLFTQTSTHEIAALQKSLDTSASMMLTDTEGKLVLIYANYARQVKLDSENDSTTSNIVISQFEKLAQALDYEAVVYCSGDSTPEEPPGGRYARFNVSPAPHIEAVRNNVSELISRGILVSKGSSTDVE